MPYKANVVINHQTSKTSDSPVTVPRRPPRRHPVTLWVLLAHLVYLGFVGITCWQGRLFVGMGPIDWEEMRYPLLSGTIALFLAALLAMRMMGSSTLNSIGFLVITFSISWLAEFSGINWGFPFGHRYHYHAALTPVLPGKVPLFIPLAWVVLGATPLVLLRNFPVYRGNNQLCPNRLFSKAALCAMFLTACDMVLDPLATSVGAWTWTLEGTYFGIPLLNFIGWFTVALVIYLTYLGLLALSRPTDNASPFSFELTWMFVNGVFMGLASVAVYYRLRNPTPMLIFFGLTLPYWGYWFTGIVRIRSKPRIPQSEVVKVSSTLMPMERSVNDTPHRP